MCVCMYVCMWASLWLSGKESAWNAGVAGDTDSIPGLGRSPGGGGMATQSSMLAWRIPWTEKPNRLQSVESQRVRHDWSNLAWMYRYVCMYVCVYIYIERERGRENQREREERNIWQSHIWARKCPFVWCWLGVLCHPAPYFNFLINNLSIASVLPAGTLSMVLRKCLTPVSLWNDGLRGEQIDWCY